MKKTIDFTRIYLSKKTHFFHPTLICGEIEQIHLDQVMRPNMQEYRKIGENKQFVIYDLKPKKTRS